MTCHSFRMFIDETTAELLYAYVVPYILSTHTEIDDRERD